MNRNPDSAQKALIAVVDDDISIQRSLARLLTASGYEAKAYGSTESLLEALESLSPDCIIADLSMPGQGGLDLQRQVHEGAFDCPIVFLTGFGDIRSSVQAMRAGAIDFLEKPIEKTVLLDAITRALVRRRDDQETTEKLAQGKCGLASLTGREREVFELVVKGLLNKQIAASLHIAEKTVKVHRARVMRKMSVRSVAELARIAERMFGMTPSH